MGSRLCNLFEDRAPVDKIYGCPISKWVAVTLIKISHQAISPNNNHHGDMPYIFMLWAWQYPTWHRIDCPILIDKELDQSNGESPGVDALRAELFHDDVIKWKHFPRNRPFVHGIHRSPVNSPHKGQWRGAFMFSLICTWINGWVNTGEAGDLKRHSAHYDVTLMCWWSGNGGSHGIESKL